MTVAQMEVAAVSLYFGTLADLAKEQRAVGEPLAECSASMLKATDLLDEADVQQRAQPPATHIVLHHTTPHHTTPPPVLHHTHLTPPPPHTHTHTPLLHTPPKQLPHRQHRIRMRRL